MTLNRPLIDFCVVSLDMATFRLDAFSEMNSLRIGNASLRRSGLSAFTCALDLVCTVVVVNVVVVVEASVALEVLELMTVSSSSLSV